MKELQSLKEVVNKLKSGCQECRGARGSGVFGHQQADQIPIQGDAGEKVTGQEVQGGSSQEERGDGMVPGATVDAARPGSIFGKPAPSQNMQEMQVRGKVNTYRKRYKTEPRNKSFTLQIHLVELKFIIYSPWSKIVLV